MILLLVLQLILSGCSAERRQDRKSLTTSSWAGTISADERHSIIKVVGEALIDGPATDDVKTAAIVDGLRRLADKLESPTCDSTGGITIYTSHYTWDGLSIYAIKTVSDGLVVSDSIAVFLDTPTYGKSENFQLIVKNMKLLRSESGEVTLDRLRQILYDRGIKPVTSQRFGGDIWQEELTILTHDDQGWTL